MKRTRGIPLFEVRGIAIDLDYSWLIILALVVWSLSAGYFPARHPGHDWQAYFVAGFAAALLFFSSIVVHELSHALVANRLGEDVRRITLFLFGGVAHLAHEPRTPGAELRIAIAGPLTSVALGLFFAIVAATASAHEAPELAVDAFEYLAFMNVALALFNLLPGFPLDGGRIARASFWIRSGDYHHATIRAANWGAAVASGIIALGFFELFSKSRIGGTWLVVVGVFLHGAARAAHRGAAAGARAFERDTIEAERPLSATDCVART